MNQFLFTERGELFNHLRNMEAEIARNVEEIDETTIEEKSIEECASLVRQRSILDCPILREDQMYQLEPKESKILMETWINDVQQSVPSTDITVVLPYFGDGSLLTMRPSSHQLSFPRGFLHSQEIHIPYRVHNGDSESLRDNIQQNLETIRKYLEWVKIDVDAYNQRAEKKIVQLITLRKDKLNQGRQLSASLGIPLKIRSDAPKTYPIPLKRKELTIHSAQPGPKGGQLDPALDQRVYEEILGIIQNISLYMEKSPKSFTKLDEPEIRDFLLLTLNSQYVLDATAETFSAAGKTDIYVLWQNHHCFIAECKIWKGEKQMKEAIDQLLSYVTWRDTKTSLIVFSNNKGFSEILNKIQKAAETHECFVRKTAPQSSHLKNTTTFSYDFHHPSDKSKELKLTVMVFNVPSSR